MIEFKAESILKAIRDYPMPEEFRALIITGDLEGNIGYMSWNDEVTYPHVWLDCITSKESLTKALSMDDKEAMKYLNIYDKSFKPEDYDYPQPSSEPFYNAMMEDLDSYTYIRKGDDLIEAHQGNEVHNAQGLMTTDEFREALKVPHGVEYIGTLYGYPVILLTFFP